MDGYLQKLEVPQMDLLDHVINCLKKICAGVLVAGAVVSCQEKRDENALFQKTHAQLPKGEYFSLYNSLLDTLKTFQINNLPAYNFLNSGNWYLDSILSLNISVDRFISSVLYTASNDPEATTDGLQYIYGEKIGGKWYFFKGPSIVIPREMIKGHNVHTPLSYRQLHGIALKEVYSGYLKRNGEINEDWFLHHFEDIGWGDFNNQKASDYFIKGKRFTDRRAFFECIRLECVRNNWRNRDTTQPIKRFSASNVVKNANE